MSVKEGLVILVTDVPCIDRDHGFCDQYLDRFVDIYGIMVTPDLPKGFKSQVLSPQLLVSEPVCHVISTPGILVVKDLKSRFVAPLNPLEE